jgi:hypothetical protein
VGKDRLTFRQFLHFQYKDGAMMLSIGGTVVDGTDDARLGKNAFKGLWFTRDNTEPIVIAPPTLTGREVRYLNRLLPQQRSKMKRPLWLSDSDRENYQQLYRYYPVFAESEL